MDGRDGSRGPRSIWDAARTVWPLRMGVASTVGMVPYGCDTASRCSVWDVAATQKSPTLENTAPFHGCGGHLWDVESSLAGHPRPCTPRVAHHRPLGTTLPSQPARWRRGVPPSGASGCTATVPPRELPLMDVDAADMSVPLHGSPADWVWYGGHHPGTSKGTLKQTSLGGVSSRSPNNEAPSPRPTCSRELIQDAPQRERRCHPLRKRELIRLVLQRPLSAKLPTCALLTVINSVVHGVPEAAADGLGWGKPHAATVQEVMECGGGHDGELVAMVDRLLAEQHATAALSLGRGFTDSPRCRDDGKSPQFAEIDPGACGWLDETAALWNEEIRTVETPLLHAAPPTAPVAFDMSCAMRCEAACQRVVLTKPTLNPETKCLSVFATVGMDLFYGSGMLPSMAPRSHTYGSGPRSGDGARVPFRWFIVPLAVVDRIPRGSAFVFWWPQRDAAGDVPGSGLLQYLEAMRPDVIYPLDTLLALGVASSHVIQATVPISLCLQIDLNPDHELDHLQSIEATLVNRYRAVALSMQQPAEAQRSAPHGPLKEGISWALGLEISGADNGCGPAETRVTVLQEFVLPKGSGTAPWGAAELFDMLDAPHLYRHRGESSGVRRLFRLGEPPGPTAVD